MSARDRIEIIAEIGENHLGNMDLALAMIEKAAQVGVDYCKFQSYRGMDVAPSDPEWEWFQRVALSDDAHRVLQEHCRRHGVQFLSSPFSCERAELLFSLGLTTVKIGSSELTNTDLLKLVNGRAKRVFLSVGLAVEQEIEEALRLLSNPAVTLLHCVSLYPTPPERINLRSIPYLAERFGRPVGFSDHTVGFQASVAACALGAQVIEKHFTLSHDLPGTDHVLSLTPEELREMVQQIRELERMLGQCGKPVSDEERAMIPLMRGRFGGRGAEPNRGGRAASPVAESTT